MRQPRITNLQKTIILDKLRNYLSKGVFQHEAANQLGLTVASVRSLCSRYGIIGWPTGAAVTSQVGSNNPNYKNGMGRATITRATKRTIILAGKSPFVCERCGYERSVELPRHHKDRDRSNNSPENIEVLCVSCHNKEHMPERTRDELGRLIAK